MTTSTKQSIEKSESRSSQLSAASNDDNDVMYEATAQVMTSNAQAAQQRIIPRLEDKYQINAALDELAAASATAETHSEAASYTSSVQQSSMSSRTTQQSEAYSSMTSASSSTVKSAAVKAASIKSGKDSSYSTCSSVSSSSFQQQSSSEMVHGNVLEVSFEAAAL